MQIYAYHTFVKKFLVVIVFCIAIIYGMLLFLPPETYMDSDYSIWQAQKDAIYTDSDKQEVVFLGDSRQMAGLIPEQLSSNAYNLALDDGSPLEMYYTMKYYLKHHPKPKAVFAAFASTHYRLPGPYKTRTLYFHYLEKEDVEESQQVLLSYNEELGAKLENDIDNFLYQIRWPGKYAGAIAHGHFLRSERNIKDYNQMKQGKGHVILTERDGAYEPNGDEKLAAFEILPSNRYYLEKLFSLCSQEGIPVILEQLPVNQTTADNLQASYIDDYEAEMTSLNKIPGITKVAAEILVYGDEYFGDPSHLNKRGAEKYTQYIKEKYVEYFH